MLEALFAVAAKTVFSYILDTLEPAERLPDWPKRGPAKLAYQHALAGRTPPSPGSIPNLRPS